MSLVVPTASRAAILNMILNKDAPEELDLHLFQNDVTPGNATVIGNLTEATFTGYAAIQLSNANFSTPTNADPSVSTYNAAQAFTSSAGSQNQTIYGYYVTRRTTADLLWVERFAPGDITTIVNNGDAVNVTPRITLDDEQA